MDFLEIDLNLGSFGRFFQVFFHIIDLNLGSFGGFSMFFHVLSPGPAASKCMATSGGKGSDENDAQGCIHDEPLGARWKKWVCLKIGYIPNEIAIFHRDNDQQNHWV